MTTNTIKQQNPILQSEFRYQRFVIERSRNGGFWIFLAILIVAPSVLISLAYTIAVLLNLFPSINVPELPLSWRMNMFYTLIVANISMYTVVTLVTIGLSSSSIRREKEKHTWSLLRLTNISSNQIVLGKWWASLRALNGDHAMVIILRVGLVANALMTFFPTLHQGTDLSAMYPLYFLWIMPLIIIHAILDAALSAILGIAGAIPEAPWNTVGSSAILIIRLFLSIGVAWWLWIVLVQLHNDITQALYTTVYAIIGTLLLMLVTLIVARVLITRS